MSERYLEAGSKETGVQKDSGHDISLPDQRRIYRQKGSRMKMDELRKMNKKVC
jgi:hypothetical protein